MSRPALSVRNLRISIKSPGGWLPIVKNISFDLHPGEIKGLAGESGCGKTLTALAIMNLLPAPLIHIEAERLSADGIELTGMNPAAVNSLRGEVMAMIFQDPASSLDPVFKVGFQIAATLRRKLGITKKQSKLEVSKALAEVGFDQPERIYHLYPHELSGGMKQLVMIAMATALKPSILIADEPTTALDVTTQGIILHHLKTLSSQHQTAILMITHDLRVLAQIADEIMVMYHGRIVESGACNALLGRPYHPYTAGLIAAVPRLTTATHLKVQPIEGVAPAWGNGQPGCAFAPRCEHADEACRTQLPELNPVESGLAACHHPL